MVVTAGTAKAACERCARAVFTYADEFHVARAHSPDNPADQQDHNTAYYTLDTRRVKEDLSDKQRVEGVMFKQC